MTSKLYSSYDHTDTMRSFKKEIHWNTRKSNVFAFIG